MGDAIAATITVLFTDMVDSTGLLRHGPDVANQLRRRHDASTGDAVRRHRGVVVKTTGDGLMATFASAGDAVSAAVAVQQVVDQLRHRDPRMPAVRVGLSTGEATPEEGDWYGPAVIEAARLCADADGGRILAAGVTALLVGDQRGHRFVALEPRLLKGFEAPVPLSEVAWEPLPRLVLPPAVESALATTAPFVGRANELDQLLQAWKLAATGTRTVALVAGEPGVGKTRLLAELARLAVEDGATVLWGRCDEEPVLPYQPFVEQIRQWLAAAPGRTLASGLERLLPETAQGLGSPELNPLADPDAQRLRLFEAAGDMYRTVAAEDPVLVVVDDLHWAAAPTLLLLRHVVAALTGDRMLLVGAYRDTELDRHHPFADVLADLRREEGVMRLSLDGIDTQSVVELLERVGGEVLDDDGLELARLVRAETKGNPFFLTQVLRHLTETGALTRADGRWTVGSIEALGLPEGVREVVGRRLSALSDDANAVLSVAAVIGPEFEIDPLAEVLDLSAEIDRVLDALDACARTRLIREVADTADRYEFVHALVRQTLLAELSAARRARLHRRIGDALAARDAPPAALALHYCAGATASAVDEALRWSIVAAQGAMDSWAPEEMLGIVDRGLHVSALSPERHAADLAVLHLLESHARSMLGDSPRSMDAAARAAENARVAGDARTFAAAAAARGGWPIVGVPDPLARELFAEALEMLGPDEHGQRSRVLGSFAFYLANSEGHGTAVIPMLEEAVEMAQASGIHADLLHSLTDLLAVYTGHHDLARQREIIADVEATLAVASDSQSSLSAHMVDRHQVNLAVQTGDLTAARAAIEASTERERQHGTRSGFTAMWQGALALMEGRWEDAEDCNARLGEFATDPNFANSWSAQLFALRREQGRSTELLPIIDALVESSPGLVAMRTVYAVALIDAGGLDEAHAILRDLAADDLAAVPRDTTWSSSLAYLAEVCAAAGDVALAPTLRKHLLPFSGQLLVVAWTVFCLGAADRYIGMLDAVLGDHEASASRFESALRLEEAAGATALAATTRGWRQRALGT